MKSSQFALLLVLTFTAQAQPPVSVQNAIKAREAREHPGDFYMQKIMYDAGCRAFDEISEMRNKGVPGVPVAILVAIINKMMARYPDDYYMQKIMINSECKSYSALH